MGGKAEPFSWRSVEYDAVKYLENIEMFRKSALIDFDTEKVKIIQS